MEPIYPDSRLGTYEDGSAYEEFVYNKIEYLLGIKIKPFIGKNQQLLGENNKGIEIKFDGRMKETNNIYIETAEKSRANKTEYFPSGIFRDDNSKWYWIGDYAEAFVFEKFKLQKYIEHKNFKSVTTSTSKGVLMPKEIAMNICKRHFPFSLKSVPIAEQKKRRMPSQKEG